MKELFTPDELFSDFSKVTPAFLGPLGIRALFCDIDNTLAPYEVAKPTQSVRAWVDSLATAGVRVILISNNHKERVDAFNESLSLPAYPDSRKPGKAAYLRAMKELRLSPGECAVLGDQLFTDIYAGKRLGMRGFLVPPIKDKTNLFFKTKRRLERPILKSFAKKRRDFSNLTFWNIKED